MTCTAKFKTKKALKKYVAKKGDFTVIDPSICDEYYGSAKELIIRKGSICVTNHPERKWFASVKLVDGQLKVT